MQERKKKKVHGWGDGGRGEELKQTAKPLPGRKSTLTTGDENTELHLEQSTSKIYPVGPEGQMTKYRRCVKDTTDYGSSPSSLFSFVQEVKKVSCLSKDKITTH